MSKKNIGYHLKRLIFFVSPRIAEDLGFDFRMKNLNRLFLEKQIFGYINVSSYGLQSNKCLFVGVKRYTWHYHRLLDCDYYSIDSNPKEAKYGVNNKHVIGSVLDLSNHFQKDTFQFIIINGLIGFGINDADSTNEMLYQAYNTLKKDGILIIGYNDNPKRLVFDIESLEVFNVLQSFSPNIRGLSDKPHRILDDSEHCYLFLKKRA